MAKKRNRNVKEQMIAVAYARYSSNNQREESIDAQLRAIRSYCETNDIELLECFTDEATTAKNDSRDNFQRMISGIIKGHYQADLVLVHKFNRFARNKYDSAIYKKRLKDVGVKVVSVSQNIENTPEGEMLEGFLEVIDEYYSNNLAHEVRKGLRENALNGKHTGGVPPLGLSTDINGFYVKNHQAPLVVRIFEEYAAGVPQSDIIKGLHREGHRNQRGKTFNSRTIYDIVRNEKYIGNFIYTINNSEVIRLNGIIEPIIDLDLWARVQKLNNQPVKARLRHQKVSYFLTGKMFCENCGYQICGNGSKRDRSGNLIYYYKCVGNMKHKVCSNPSLNKVWLENKVLNAVIKTVMDKKQLEHISQLVFAELQALQKKPKTTSEELKKERKKLVAKQERLTDLYLDGEMDKSMLDTKNSELRERTHDIDKELEKLKAVEELNGIKKETIYNYLLRYFERLKLDNSSNNDEFMRAVFSSFVEKIVVSDSNITVDVITDFSVLDVGDNKKLGGAIRRLSPVELCSFIPRKKSPFGRNEV